VAALLLSGVPLLAGGCCPLIGAVFIPDSNLERALRQELGQPFGCLTADSLASITELQADGQDIVSLEGLEYCTGLTVLNVRNNLVQSITPLTDLNNLVRVDLTNNAVRNIEPMAGDLMEIFDWSPLTANVNATRGLGAGDVAVLPTVTTVNSDGNPLPNFADAFQALQAAGVNVVFGEVVESPTN
jgi:Leucine-rich repeat (LRR) protein